MANISNDFKAILKRIPGDLQPVARKLINELAWMQKTLAKLKNEVDTKGVVIKYMNGSAKDSAALKAYNATIQKYGNLYKQLTRMMSTPPSPESDELISFIE
jgi:hypothetical protein